MYLVHNHLPQREHHDHEIGGLRFTFRPAFVPGRQRAMVAKIADGQESAVRAAIVPHGGKFRVLDDADVHLDGAPVPSSDATSAAAAADLMPSVRDIIMRQGWATEDLDGLPPLDGHRLDRDAGCSTRTGLSAAEMMLITAPPDWADHAHVHYPWEVPGFRPTPGFRPPSTGQKYTPPPEPSQGDAPPEPSTETDTAAKSAAPPDIDPKTLDGDDPALTAYHPDPEVVAAARKVVATLIVGTVMPTIQKANANLKANALPTTNTNGLQALLAPVS